MAQQIANSNLLLLITDAVCDCSIFPPVLLEAKEVKYILGLKAELYLVGGGCNPFLPVVTLLKNLLLTLPPSLIPFGNWPPWVSTHSGRLPMQHFANSSD